MSDPQPRIRVINPNSNETVTRGERRSARKRCASIDAIVRLPQPDTPITTTTEGSSIRQRRSCSGPKARSLVEPISPGAVKLVFVQPEVAWYRSCRRYWTRKTCVTQIEWRLKKAKGRLSRRAPVWRCETGARRGNWRHFFSTLLRIQNNSRPGPTTCRTSRRVPYEGLTRASRTITSLRSTNPSSGNCQRGQL
jgi:hypothetical protein